MMKTFVVLLAICLIGILVWMAAGPNKKASAITMAAPRAMGASPPITQTARETLGTRHSEPVVPPEVIAPIASVPAAPIAGRDGGPVMLDPEAPRPMIVPVAGIGRNELRDTFNEARGNRRHEAIDILAPRGTPVVATDDGVVKKLFTSVPGGLTVYEFDPDQRFCYYYAHLDRYAAGLHEGQALHRGEILGYVGTTGNAPPETPHLHFALIRLDPERRWWKGTYVNPYPALTR